MPAVLDINISFTSETDRIQTGWRGPEKARAARHSWASGINNARCTVRRKIPPSHRCLIYVFVRDHE